MPFGSGEADGFVVAVSTQQPEMQVKPVKYAYDLGFLPDPQLMRLARVLAERCCVPLSSSLSLLWPPFVPRAKAVASRGSEEELPGSESIGAQGTAQWEIPEDDSGASGATAPSLIWGDSAYRWERYTSLITQARSEGRGAIVLVPEFKGAGRRPLGLRDAFGATSSWCTRNSPAFKDSRSPCSSEGREAHSSWNQSRSLRACAQSRRHYCRRGVLGVL